MTSRPINFAAVAAFGPGDRAYAALYAAQQGLPVFPLRPRGKTPFLPGGYKIATIDTIQVVRWLTQYPEANVGLWPGPAALVVIDIDDPEGERDAEALGLFSEPTPTVRTPNGGWHQYRLHPFPGRLIGNLKLGASNKIDVRADAGHVVLPPSRLDGGREYSWPDFLKYPDYPHEARPLPPLVCEIIEGLVRREEEEKKRRRSTKAGKATSGVSWGHQGSDQRIPEGERNDRLFRIASALRGKGLSAGEVLARLRVENERCDPPLPTRDLERTARSVGRYPAGVRS